MQVRRCLSLLVAAGLSAITAVKCMAGGNDICERKATTQPMVCVPCKAAETMSPKQALELASKLAHAGAYDDALVFCRKALDSPDSAVQADALPLLIDILSKQQSKKESEDTKEGFLALGRLWNVHGKRDEAIGAYERALEASSGKVRAAAANEAAEVIRSKTLWWRQYGSDPAIRFLGSQPVVLVGAVALLALLVRTFKPRVDLLITPNATIADVLWLQVLVQDYTSLLGQMRVIGAPHSNVPSVDFGAGSQLIAELFSQLTNVGSGPIRQWVVRFFQKPRFELDLSLPANDQRGIVTAVLKSPNGKEHFVKEFPANGFPDAQRDIAYWIAYTLARYRHQ